MRTEADRFNVVTEKGNRYVVIVWQHWRQFQPLSGSAQKVPASSELLTECGLDVNERSDGTYEILQTDEIARPV